MSDTYSKLLRAIETNPIGAETVNAGVNIPSDYSPRPQEASSSFMRDFKDYVAAAPKVVQQLVTPEPGREYGNVLPISYDAANPQDWRWDPKGGIVGGLMTTPGRIAEAWQAGTDPNATQQQQVNAATQGALEALGLSSMGFKPHGALGTFIFRITSLSRSQRRSSNS